jgi:hypothetical protein
MLTLLNEKIHYFMTTAILICPLWLNKPVSNQKISGNNSPEYPDAEIKWILKCAK